jgi:site-specific DNA recombinase
MAEPRKSPKLMPYRKRKNSREVMRPREDWIGIPVPPIIDIPTWQKAQDRLRDNAHHSRRNNNKHHYLLRGMVVCGVCGSIASGYVSNKSTYYSCGAKRHGNITTNPHDELVQVKHQPFDDKVWAGLVELLGNPHTLNSHLQKSLDARTAPSQVHEAADDSDKELARLEAQENRILDAYREEVITLQDLKAQKDKIAARRQVLIAKKKAARSHTESLGQPQITLDMLGRRFRPISACHVKGQFCST